MTLAEQAALIEGEPFGVLATVGASGHPHLATIGFAFDGLGKVVMTSFRAAQKVANARRNPVASLLVERTSLDGETRGILLRGEVEIVADPAGVARCYRAVNDRSGGLIRSTDLPDVDEHAPIAKRVALVLSIQHRSSWDHRRLGGTY